MNFLIADTFTDSLSRLTGDEQKAVKTTAFDLQLNPVNPGMSFHRLDRAKDKDFWSIRVSGDIRVIVHKTTVSLLLCYVDHHDKAYDWAERRKIQTHPITGAAQILELRETVKEIIIPKYIKEPDKPQALPITKKLFESVTDDELLSYGVPAEWIKDVRAATDDNILTLADHLPAEAAEAILELATGGQPRKPVTRSETQNPFDHPDAKRRFKAVSTPEDLQQAMAFPWDKWTVFLHPDQRSIVEQNFNGAARVAGSAGTGKTIVALHRAVFIARNNPNSRVLLATFSGTLASALHTKLQRLIAGEPKLGERIEVSSLNDIGLRLYKTHLGPVKIIDSVMIASIVKNASQKVGDHRFTIKFLMNEWTNVVDTWQLKDWEAYRDVSRLGRRTRLNEAKRRQLWDIFSLVMQDIEKSKLKTIAAVFTDLAKKFKELKHPVFEFLIIDEAQDIDVGQLKMLSIMSDNRPNALFLAGDSGQRIFQQPFSWKSLGIDIRGRSKTLRVNYRTSHQIRAHADKLLESEITDAEGITENRRDVISVFNGKQPEVLYADNQQKENKGIAKWLLELAKEGVLPHECGLFVRSDAQIPRAEAAVTEAGIPYKKLNESVETSSGKLSICTMHLAKGLEFRAVVVMACDDEILPLQERIEEIGDSGDLQDVYDTERHLLYVACTRARDFLLVSGVVPASEFIEDFR